MIPENLNLPDVGTPEAAKKKMIEGYASFVDSAAKFLTLAEYYADSNHEGQALDTTFQSCYTVNYQKLKNASVDDFGLLLSFYALVYLSYVDDVKANLTQYGEMLKGTSEADQTDYDRACDYLTVKDEFTDLENVLNDVNRQIAEERLADTHYNDPEYDVSAKTLDEKRFHD
jgi:hypothetical protein